MKQFGKHTAVLISGTENCDIVMSHQLTDIAMQCNEVYEAVVHARRESAILGYHQKRRADHEPINSSCTTSVLTNTRAHRDKIHVLAQSVSLTLHAWR